MGSDEIGQVDQGEEALLRGILMPWKQCLSALSIRRVHARQQQQQNARASILQQSATNDAFFEAFGFARSRNAALLWLPPEATPLQERWLEAVQCEQAHDAADAWMVGSAMLMDCRLRWEPFPRCCAAAAAAARGGSGGGAPPGAYAQSADHLSATGLYAAHDTGFYEYVREWAHSRLRSSSSLDTSDGMRGERSPGVAAAEAAVASAIGPLEDEVPFHSALFCGCGPGTTSHASVRCGVDSSRLPSSTLAISSYLPRRRYGSSRMRCFYRRQTRREN